MTMIGRKKRGRKKIRTCPRLGVKEQEGKTRKKQGYEISWMSIITQSEGEQGKI